jgi:hypothetical protein
MHQDQFVKVFDILDSGYKNWPFAAFGLIAVAAGIVVAALPYILPRFGIPFAIFQSRAAFGFSRYFMLAFGVLWTLGAFALTYSQYHQHELLARQGACQLIEGSVEQFQPQNPSGSGLESFVVSGVQFRYSNAIVTDGFNDTAANGGPIKGGEYLRICYDPHGNVILRLEIRGFTGEVKDYSRAHNFFAQVGANRNVPGTAVNLLFQWIGTAIFVVVLIDFSLITVLFRPYLKAFIRLKRIATGEVAVSAAVQLDRAIKLSNTLIRWDRTDRAIWLRPRGYNLVQVPGMVAKLNLSADERSIASDEIRLSWTLVVICVLFLVGIYSAVTSMPFTNAQARQTAFIGMLLQGAMVVGFFCFVSLRLRRHMDRLVQEALQEIADMTRLGPSYRSER